MYKRCRNYFFKAHDFLTHHFIAMYGHLRVHACRQINSWKQIVLENMRRENAPFFQSFSDLNNLPSCSHKSEIWLQLLWENIWLRKVFLWVTTDWLDFFPPNTSGWVKSNRQIKPWAWMKTKIVQNCANNLPICSFCQQPVTTWRNLLFPCSSSNDLCCPFTAP